MARIFAFIFAFLLLGVAIRAEEDKRDIYTGSTSLYTTEGSSSSISTEYTSAVSTARTSATSVGVTSGITTEESGATSSAVSSSTVIGTSTGETGEDSTFSTLFESSDTSDEVVVGTTTDTSINVSSEETSGSTVETDYELVSDRVETTSTGETSKASSAESVAETSATTKGYTTEESSAVSSDKSEATLVSESTVYSEVKSSGTTVGTTSSGASDSIEVFTSAETSRESTTTEVGYTTQRSSSLTSEESTVESSSTEKVFSTGTAVGTTTGVESATTQSSTANYDTRRDIVVSSREEVLVSSSSSEKVVSIETDGGLILESTIADGSDASQNVIVESTVSTDYTTSTQIVSETSGESTVTSSAMYTYTSSEDVQVKSSELDSEESTVEQDGTTSGESTIVSTDTTQGTTSSTEGRSSESFTTEESSAESVETISNTVKESVVESSLFESSATSQETTWDESSAESRDASSAESIGVTSDATVISSQVITTLTSEEITTETSVVESSEEVSAESTEASTFSSQFVSSDISFDVSSAVTSEESSEESTITTDGYSSETSVGVTTEDSSEESSTFTDAESSDRTLGVTTSETAEISYRYETDVPIQVTVLQFVFTKPASFDPTAFLALLAEAAETSVGNLTLVIENLEDNKALATVNFGHPDPADGFAAANKLYIILQQLQPTGVKRGLLDALREYGIEEPEITGFADPTDNNCASFNAAACGKNQQYGECYDADNDGAGFCNCYSGISGNQCDETLADYNPYAVDSSAAGFNATFDFVADDEVTFTFRVPSAPRYDSDSQDTSYGLTTFIRFAAGSSCNYPEEKRWNISTEKQDSGFTNDVYTATFSYNELVACGLQDQNANGTFHIFSSSVSVLRKYKLIKEIFKLDRSASNSFTYKILFPSKTSVQTSIEVVDNDLVQFLAVTDSSFDIVDDEWSLTFTSLTRAPYQLQLTENNHTISPSSDRVELDSGADSFAVSECVDSPSDTDHCEQRITVKAKGCDVLNFALTLGFKIQCRTSNPFGSLPTAKPCVEPAVTSIAPTFNVLTSSSCPLEKESPIQDQAMASYKDAALSQAETYFGKSNNIFFAVAFDSPANIDDVELDNVCIQKSGASTEDCTLTFVDLENTIPAGMTLASEVSDRTDSPVRSAFSVTGEAINTLVPLDPYAFTSVVIKANYLVTYKGSFQKKRASFVGTANTALLIQLSGLEDASVLKPGQKIGDKSSASAATASIFAIILAIACLIA